MWRILHLLCDAAVQILFTEYPEVEMMWSFNTVLTENKVCRTFTS